jgi:hypothetical protein
MNVSLRTTRLQCLAPLAALVVMCGLSRWLPNRVTIDDRSIDRQAEIRRVMDALPFFVEASNADTLEEWVGRDLSELLAPEAQRLLRPNAIFNRRYERLERRDDSEGPVPWVQVLVVHCADARDMIGHYPPICYPSAGWVAESAEGPQRVPLPWYQSGLPVQTYQFRAVREHGRDLGVRIFNTFVLPDGTVTPDIDDINRQSERLAVSVQGVAQLQVITPQGLPSADARLIAGEVLAGLEDLFEVLAVIPRRSDA